MQCKFIESLERRRLLAFALSVNFQPSGAATPSGYAADTGATYASRGNGYSYGWNQSAATFTRDRNNKTAPDQRYDTLVHTQLYGERKWELAVPNGTYNVRIVAGDPSYTDSSIRLAAENTIVAEGALSSSRHFIDASKSVSVSDGRLTISNASGAQNNKICFVQVTSIDASQNTIAITAPDALASESGASGYFKVTRTGPTSSSLMLNYLIGGSAENGADYNTLSGSVTIAAGATSANITVTPRADDLVEGTESCTLTLQPASGYSLGSSIATVNIADANNTPAAGGWPASWSAGPAIPKARWESSAVAMDGKVWVYGGWMSASTTGTQQFDMYDVAANKWTTLGYGPVPHTHAGVAADPASHVIYFAGGLYSNYPGTPANGAWKYDTIAKKWSTLPSMPENHSSGTLKLVNNQLHYIGGVLDDRETNTGRHLVLDLDNLAAGWTVAPSMPDPRDHFASVVLNGKIICIGGEFGHDITHDQQSLVDEYDPIAKTWTRLASMPINKSHAESATYVTPDGKIIVAGGQVDDWKSTNNVVEYDRAKNQWTTLGTLPVALQGPVVQQVGNKIVVTTGNQGSGPTTNTWVGVLT
jgi:N-acetylneuraminic acid mutarotase